VAKTAKNASGEAVQVARRNVFLDAPTEDVIARVIAEVRGVDNRSAAIRWMAGPALAELDRIKGRSNA